MLDFLARTQFVIGLDLHWRKVATREVIELVSVEVIGEPNAEEGAERDCDDGQEGEGRQDYVDFSFD